MALESQLKKTKLTKKIARDQILSILENSLVDLQNALGEKKFRRKIKKASKLLSTGLPKAGKIEAKKAKNIILTEPGRENILQQIAP